jgi:F420-dependent oxidoreductase-like protein
MRIGVAIPPDYRDLARTDNAVDSLIDQAKQLAAAGVGAVWLVQRFDYDAVTVAAMIAREVPDIHVGTAVVPIYPRHPIALSMQAQTTQAASHGRFTLGIGMTDAALVTESYGIAKHPRIRHLREYLTALNQLFETGRADVTGDTLIAKSPLDGTLPGATRVPVLVAAAGDLTLRVAAELADGALPIWSGPKTLANYTVPTMLKYATAPRIATVVSGLVTSDPDAARTKAAANMHAYLRIPTYRAALEREGLSDPTDLVIAGDERHLADEISRYEDAGATELIFTQTSLGSAEDERRTWQLLGELSRS